MNGLVKFMHKIKPTFSEGGKLSFLHSTFEAFESFLYVPGTVTAKGTHVKDAVDGDDERRNTDGDVSKNTADNGTYSNMQ